MNLAAAVVTGKPGIAQPQAVPQTQQPKESFSQVLDTLLLEQEGVSFSKHAAQRAAQRSIDLSADNIARLNAGVRLAEEKGLNDTLILVDKTAFVVNVPNNLVITAVHGTDLDGNVFTNIDGTVIM